jgi:tetratricopeptide (TPR) repeat protein
VQAAQEFFARGNTAYNLGHFDEAADVFSKAYEAWPQPEFLYNIAQSYRLGLNCKQALHFYKRFRSLKDQDTVAPLSQKKKDEIEKFITELTECVANADRSAVAQPDTIVKPQLTPPSAPPTPVAVPTTPAPPAAAPSAAPGARRGASGRTAALEPKDDDEDGDDAVAKQPPSAGPQLVVARLTGGVAMISAGDLGVPVQPVFGLIGGYPIHLAPLTLELGAALSYTPLPYTVMNDSRSATMLGFRATAVASYPIWSRLSLRGHIGAGVVSLSGLEAGNPIVVGHQAGSFMLSSVAVGVAADYEITPNIVATVSPLNLGAGSK